MSSRRLLPPRLCALAYSFALALVSSAQAAQPAFPSKPIRFIVPYAAGGTTDLVARLVGSKMADALGQAVVIDNRGGAGGNIGMDAVAKAAPDGYTVGMGAISTNALNPHVYPKMSFDPRKDFTAIALLGNSTIVLEVGPQVPVKNVAELIAYARKNPGLAYATAGAGTSMNLAGVLFAQTVKVDMTHVPYKGSAPGIADLLGGQVPVMFDNLPASLPQIQSGKLRALAVAGSQRSPSLPNVATIAESGLPGYSVEPWFGLYGPAGLPPAVVQKLNRAVLDALASPEVKEKLTAAGFSPRGSSAAELEALSRQDYERLGKIAAAAHMTTD
jgi:tripartite-type tricarboxylate transporter receptor subunit TctC